MYIEERSSELPHIQRAIADLLTQAEGVAIKLHKECGLFVLVASDEKEASPTSS